MKSTIQIFLMTLLVSALGIAGVKQQVDLENQLQNRIKNLVNTYDPLATVQIKVKLKSTLVNLPGTNTQEKPIVMLDSDGSLVEESIDSIVIKVTSHMPSLPAWLESEIKDEIALGKVPTSIVFSKFSNEQTQLTSRVSQTIESLRTTQLETKQETQGALADSKDNTLFSWLFWQSLLVPFLFIYLVGLWFTKKWQSDLLKTTFVPALQARSEKSDAPVSQPYPSEDLIADSPHVNSAIQSLGDLSSTVVNSVLSDAYWCEEDGYAAYFWSLLSASQREKVLQSINIDKNYFTFLRYQNSVVGDSHLDPSYFSVNLLEKVNQPDLAKWLIKQPAYIHKLSIMRKKSLPIQLADRLNWLDLPVPSMDLAHLSVPSPSAPRKLHTSLELNQMSTLDEEYVYQNPEKVKMEWCSSFKSLVWLGLCSDDFISQALEDLDARALAFAWVGPEAVLNQLKSCLPESKAKNLEYYLTQVEPSRRSRPYQSLVDVGISEYLKSRSHATQASGRVAA